MYEDVCRFHTVHYTTRYNEAVKYLFIDSNNLGCRASFANKDLGVDLLDHDKDYNPDDALKHESWFPTGAMHGFFRMIASIRRAYPDRYICAVWDGKSRKRIVESKAAVEKGIIPQYYKANRGSPPEQVVNFHRQKPEIMTALSMTNIPQIIKPDEEADDIIASCVTVLSGNDILIATSDKDYYQLLGEGVAILDPSGTILDEAWFRNAYGVSPGQWVDVGALAGDDGDCIYGVCWWGITTAAKEVSKHGNCENVLSNCLSTYGHLKINFPDVDGSEFDRLKSLETKDGKKKYPHIKKWMPFTGVALAAEDGRVKVPRIAIMLMVYGERVPLAKSLKAMHRDIPVPKLPVALGRNETEKFTAFCRKYSLNEVEALANLLCSPQPMS